MSHVGIKIKNVAVLRGLFEKNYDPVLVDIIVYVAETYGLVMTESFREKLHANDLHGEIPVRAVDIREWAYPKHLAQEIEDDVNSKWIYDPNRPHKSCAWIHENRKTKGFHFHIQTHPNTRRVM